MTTGAVVQSFGAKRHKINIERPHSTRTPVKLAKTSLHKQVKLAKTSFRKLKISRQSRPIINCRGIVKTMESVGC